MGRLLLCVPSFDGTVKARTAEAIGNMDTSGCDVTQLHVGGYSVARARNIMAQAALDGAYDHLLMVDSDMVPPPDALQLLLSHGVDVCMGWAVRGTSDEGRTSAIRLHTRNFEASYYANELSFRAEQGEPLMQVKGNGMAFALVRTSVFARLQRPWFKYVDYPDGSALGEDYYFCQQCNTAGIQLHVDARVHCGHIHDRVL